MKKLLITYLTFFWLGLLFGHAQTHERDFIIGSSVSEFYNSDHVYADDNRIFGIVKVNDGTWITEINTSDIVSNSARLTGGVTPGKITLDNEGNILVYGFFGSTIDFNPNGVAVNKTSVGTGGDAFVAKYNTDLELIWVVTFDDINPLDITSDGSSNVYLTGTFNGTQDFDPTAGTSTLSAQGSNSDLFVLKLSSAGNYSSSFNIGGTATSVNFYEPSIEVDASQNIYIGGAFAGGSFSLNGSTSLSHSGTNYEGFLAKYNSSNILQWHKHLIGTADAQITDIALFGSNVYVSGGFEGTLTLGTSVSEASGALTNNAAFLAQYSSTGTVNWMTIPLSTANDYTSLSNGQLPKVEVDKDGTIWTLVAGTYGSTGPSFLSRLFRFNNSGVEQFEFYLGSSNNDTDLSVNNRILVFAELNTSTQFDDFVDCFADPVITSVEASRATVAAGESVTLTVNGNLGSDLKWSWSDQSCGGTEISDRSNFTSAALSSTTTFYVQATNGCVTVCDQITVTVDDTAPSPNFTTLSPADNASAVSTTANLVIAFDEPIEVAGEGIRVWKDGVLVELVGNANVSVSGNTLTANPSTVLENSAQYYVTIDNGYVRDLVGNQYTGFNNSTIWNFTTEAGAPTDSDPPLISGFSPADEATGVAVDIGTLTINFNEPVRLASSPGLEGTNYFLELRNKDNNTVVKQFELSSTDAEFTGSSLILKNVPTLASSTNYNVRYWTFTNQPIEDLSGNKLASFNNNTTWNFETAAPADNTAPTISLYSPTLGATNVGLNDNIVITFDEPVEEPNTAFSQRIILWKIGSSNNTQVEVFSMTNGAVSSRVSGLGTTTITIDSTEPLEYSTEYAVTQSRSFQDLAGNIFEGLASITDWRFTTVAADVTKPAIASAVPAKASSDVDVNLGTIVLTMTEPVNRGPSGQFRLRQSGAGDPVVKEWNVVDASDLTVSGNTITLAGIPEMQGGTMHYLQFTGFSNSITDDAGNSLDSWTVSTVYNFVTADPPAIVNIPDADFKSYLVGNTAINTNGDSDIQVSEAEAFTGLIQTPSNTGITDLTGIEAFINLTRLNVTGGSNGKLSSVDLSALSQLELLSLGGHDLVAIDLTNNGALTSLNLADNPLTSLDLSANTQLTGLSLIRCSALSGLDLSNNSALISLNIQQVGLSQLDLSNNTSLENITIDNNNLPSFDPGSFPSLSFLSAESVGLTSIDFSSNPDLTEVILIGNNLTVLDFSQNTLMEWYFLSNNDLTSVNLQNGNNAAVRELDLTNNPNLQCVLVDDVSIFESNSSVSIDTGVTFSTTCNTDNTPPTIVSFNPVDGATNVALDEVLSVTFDQPIQLGSGVIGVRRVSDNSIVINGTASSETQIFSVSGSTLNINLGNYNTNAPLGGTEYFVEIFNGAVQDLAGNPFAEGFNDNATWNFTTGIAKTDQTITFAALSDKTFGDAPFELTATASSGLPVSYDVISGPASVTGTTLTITGAGEVTVEASQPGDDDFNAATPVQQSFTVNKAAQSITFEVLSSKTFGDAAFDLTASSNSELTITYSSSDETVATVSGSTVTIVGAGTTDITASQAGNENYQAATEVVQSLTVDKATQTITFEDIPDQALSTGSVELSATASSGLAIDFTLDAGDGTISGSTLTFNSTGTFTVTASQAGTSNIAAASASQSFIVTDDSKQDQVITFEPVSAKAFGDAPFELSATADSGLPVTFTSSDPTVISIDGTTATVVGAGEVTLFANQTGDDTYNPAPEQSQTLTVSKADQSITFDALAESTFGDPAIVLSATADSGLPITYESSNTSVATVSGATLTIVGAGTTTITASQAGNDDYNAATDVAQELVVAKATQTVTFEEIAEQDINAGSVVLAATASSELAIDFVLEAGDGTISGNVLSFNSTGIYTVNAIQAGNDNYLEANARQTFLVSDNSKQSQTITFDAISDVTYGDVLTPSATASSGLSVTYSIVSGPATISGGEVTFTGTGTVILEANQAGDADFNPAPSVEQSFEVLPATLEVTADDQSTTFNEAIPELTYSISGFVNGEDETILTATPAVSTTAAVGDDAGTYPITVSGGEAANYAFTYIEGTLTIEKAVATITLTDLEQEADGTAKLPTVTTDPADLVYTITFDGSADAPTEAGEYQVEVTIDETNYQGTATETFVLTGEEEVLSVSGEAQLQIYPNPVVETLTVTGQDIKTVYLLDMEGRVIKEQSGRSEVRWNVSDLSEGVYLLRIIDGDKQEQIRRIIKK